MPIRGLSYYSMATRMPAVRRSCEDNARVVTVVHTSAALHYNVSGAKSRQYVSKCTNYRDCTVLSEQCTHAQLCTDSRTCHGRQYRPHIDAVRVICRDASQAELILLYIRMFGRGPINWADIYDARLFPGFNQDQVRARSRW